MAIIISIESELKPKLKILFNYEILIFQKRKFYITNKIVVIQSGIGEINENSATEAFINFIYIQKDKTEYIINIWLYDSLKKEYKIRDILIIKDIIHYDFNM